MPISLDDIITGKYAIDNPEERRQRLQDHYDIDPNAYYKQLHMSRKLQMHDTGINALIRRGTIPKRTPSGKVLGSDVLDYLMKKSGFAPCNLDDQPYYNDCEHKMPNIEEDE